MVYRSDLSKVFGEARVTLHVNTESVCESQIQHQSSDESRRVI
jgi:hypothetical protein